MHEKKVLAASPTADEKAGADDEQAAARSIAIIKRISRSGRKAFLRLLARSNCCRRGGDHN